MQRITDRLIAEQFIDALKAKHGIVAVVGAGGKKTTLHRLIEAHRVVGTRRIALTTTVKMAPPAPSLNVPLVVGNAETILSAVRSNPGSETCVFLASPSTITGRLSGLPPDLIRSIHIEGAFDVTLVKADGARMRLIKAPGDDEPLLPDGFTTVLPIVSARVFGRSVSARIAHRPERLLTVIDEVIGAEVNPSHIARLLVSNDGALRRVGKANVVPIINMVDKSELLDFARQAAKAALSATGRFDRIVLASMTAPSPIVEVIHRSSI